MKTETLLNEILNLPFEEQKKLIQQVQKLIVPIKTKLEMEEAAEQLVSEYQSNYDLTVFTGIDIDEFYETR